jgi:hypothetical protein
MSEVKECKKEVTLIFSGQANDILYHLPNLDRKNIVDWFVSVRKISIGGGDILDYLRYLREKESSKK